MFDNRDKRRENKFPLETFPTLPMVEVQSKKIQLSQMREVSRVSMLNLK